MDENNNIQNTEITPVDTTVETNTQEENKIVLEFSTVTNGVVTTQDQIGEEIKPKEEKKSVNVVSLVILGVICLFAIIMLITAIISSNTAVAKEGIIDNNYLIFESPSVGRTTDYKVTDKLNIEVKINKMDKEEVGTYVTYSIKYKGGRDSIKDCKGWLDEDKLYINFKSIGDSFIYQSDTENELGGIDLYVINPDKSITKIDGADEHDGMYIATYSVDDSLVINTTRANSLTTIKYDDLKDTDKNGIDICGDNISKYDQNIIVEKTISYSLKDNYLNINEPKVEKEVNLKLYVDNNNGMVCK